MLNISMNKKAQKRQNKKDRKNIRRKGCSKTRNRKIWKGNKKISCYLSSKNTTTKKLLPYTRNQ